MRWKLTPISALTFVMVFGCRGGDKAGGATTAAASAAPPASAASEEPAPGGGKCKASGDKPVQLGMVTGDVYGFAVDATSLYYSSWELYGQRGDVGVIRKDGEPTPKLTSLDLEPRGLTLDDSAVYYTSGIRLMAIAKGGGDPRTIAPQFSAQQIAASATDVFGVPADYGPYDRVARIPKKGGDTKELSTAKRPANSVPPNGFSRVLVDDGGVYVTDTGNGRVLRFPPDGGKPKILANGQDKAFDLVMVGPDLYFDLARKGELLVVPKSGGTPKKLGAGLTESARIAADDRAVYTTLAGKNDGDPNALVRLVPSSGEVTKVADVASNTPVSQIALDGDCVYWVIRESSSKSLVYALRR
jgi:hypothetical protein